VEPGDSRYPGELGEPGTDDDAFYGGPSETKRLKEPCLLEVELREPPRRKIRDPPNDQNRPRYTQNHPPGTNDQRTRRLNEARRTAGLGGIGEPGRSKVPNVRRVRESEIRDMPRIAMWPRPAGSDDMKVLFLSNLVLFLSNLNRDCQMDFKTI